MADVRETEDPELRQLRLSTLQVIADCAGMKPGDPRYPKAGHEEISGPLIEPYAWQK